jgi:very-short-patch-repair endonuclease
MRRKDKAQYGFLLDTERGYWARNELMPEDADDPLSPRISRVLPFVEDRRNCLLFEPSTELGPTVMASLQAVLKSAIQVKYQLEDNELAAEPLPDMNERRLILFYESAEGGAGVLRRLLEDQQAIREVAQEALHLCHFDPESGRDFGHAPHAQEDCESACYDCLLTYYNQRDHQLLDRKAIRDFLLLLAQSETRAAPSEKSRETHLQQLLRQAGSELESEWLGFLEKHGYRLPSHAQQLIAACETRPDFLYQDYSAAIYIDGPYHDYPERQARDVAAVECLEDLGYFVIRFGYQEDWSNKIAQYPTIFGRPV